MYAQFAPPFPRVPYGARELKAVARKYMLGATIVGSAVWSGIFLLLLLVATLLLWRSQPRIVSLSPIDIYIPPSIRQVVQPPSSRPVRPTPARVGLPIPVPDVEAPPDQTIYTQPNSLPANGVDAAVGGHDAPPSGTTPAPDDVRPSPNAPVYVDELPEAITRVDPEYPGIAREAGVEGVVLIRAFVGKNGRVEDVFVEPKFSIPMLNDAACDAVRKWVFKPAFTNNRAVGVWVAVRIRFSLH